MILAISNWIELSQKFRKQIMKAHKIINAFEPIRSESNKKVKS